MIIFIFTGVHVANIGSEFIGNHKVAMLIQNVFPFQQMNIVCAKCNIITNRKWINT